MSLLFSAWTVLVALVFLGVVIYVFMEKKEHFDEAARIPLEEDAGLPAEASARREESADLTPVVSAPDPDKGE